MMSDPYVMMVLGLPAVAIVGFVAYVMSQNSARKDEIHRLEVKLMETRMDLMHQIGGNFVSSEAFNKFETEIKGDLHQMRAILYRLADKFGIPAVLEDQDDRAYHRR